MGESIRILYARSQNDNSHIVFVNDDLWLFILLIGVQDILLLRCKAERNQSKIAQKKLLKSRNLPNFVYTVFQHSVKLFLKGKY